MCTKYDFVGRCYVWKTVWCSAEPGTCATGCTPGIISQPVDRKINSILVKKNGQRPKNYIYWRVELEIHVDAQRVACCWAKTPKIGAMAINAMMSLLRGQFKRFQNRSICREVDALFGRPEYNKTDSANAVTPRTPPRHWVDVRRSSIQGSLVH